jgi:hypothetical protein
VAEQRLQPSIEASTLLSLVTHLDPHRLLPSPSSRRLVILCGKAVAIDCRGKLCRRKPIDEKPAGNNVPDGHKEDNVASDKESECEQMKDKSRSFKSKECTSRIGHDMESAGHKAEALVLESSRSGGIRRHVKASCPAASCRYAQSRIHVFTCTTRKSPDYSDFCCETRLTFDCASRLSLDFLIILAHAFYSRFCLCSLYASERIKRHPLQQYRATVAQHRVDR